MRYKNFKDWCNERACDGYWCMFTAINCIEIMKTIDKIPFWRREKHWREEYSNVVLQEIIFPTNKKYGINERSGVK